MNERDLLRAQRRQHISTIHKFFLPVLWVLLVFSLALAPLYDTWTVALLVGSPAALIPTALITAMPWAPAARMSVGVSLMIFCALNIHQVAGRTELHFGIFVLLAFLVLYQDWKVIVGAAATTAVHHLLFNYLQQNGYSALCLSQPGFDTVVIHAAYVVVEAGMLCYLAITLERNRVGVVRSQHALQQSYDSMRQTVARAQAGIRAISSAASEIAQGNSDLAARTESQSASVMETVGTVDQLSGTVRRNATDSREAQQLAMSAAAVAVKGGSMVSQVVGTMGEIRESSRRIAEIIGVIDGIAFQTNILALNAAVEAARAGEQGRGFAVVASEVRNLAQRSAAAAKEIKELIGSSVQTVEQGGKIVDETGNTMELLVNSVKQLATIMHEMSDASQHQSDGIHRVHEAITSIDQFTQQNASLVQQVSGASGTMQANALELARLLSALDLSGADKEQPLALGHDG